MFMVEFSQPQTKQGRVGLNLEDLPGDHGLRSWIFEYIPNEKDQFEEHTTTRWYISLHIGWYLSLTHWVLCARYTLGVMCPYTSSECAFYLQYEGWMPVSFHRGYPYKKYHSLYIFRCRKRKLSRITYRNRKPNWNPNPNRTEPS